MSKADLVKKAVKKYVVTRGGARGYALGQVVELTADQARNLVNKVRPQDEVEASAANPSRATKQLRAQVENLTAANAGLADLIAELETAATKDKALADALKGARERIAAKSQPQS